MPAHIGIIACSYEGASLCYRTICNEGSDFLGAHEHPEVSLHNYPLSDYMEYIYGDDWDGVAALMRASAAKVISLGARILICPDNTIHQAFTNASKGLEARWLHIAEEVAVAAREIHCTKAGILGTRYLMESTVYPGVFDRQGIAWMVPEKNVREQINTIIFDELVYGEIRESSKAVFLSTIEELKRGGCDAVVLGCTEIPLIVQPEDSPLPVLDSTRILARAALREALARQ